MSDDGTKRFSTATTSPDKADTGNVSSESGNNLPHADNPDMDNVASRPYDDKV